MGSPAIVPQPGTVIDASGTPDAAALDFRDGSRLASTESPASRTRFGENSTGGFAGLATGVAAAAAVTGRDAGVADAGAAGAVDVGSDTDGTDGTVAGPAAGAAA